MAGRVLREAQIARSVVDSNFAALEQKSLRDRRLQSIEAGQGDNRIEVLLSKALVSRDFPCIALVQVSYIQKETNYNV